MKTSTIRRSGRLLGIVAVSLIYFSVSAFGWLMTSLVYAMFTQLLGIDFNWIISIGLWLLWFVPYMILAHLNTRRKGGRHYDGDNRDRS